MIHLSDTDKKWIKLCKGHYQDKYPMTGRWVDNLKPLFTEIYGWNPDEDNNYIDYLACVFNKLLEVQLKICDDQSGSNRQLKDIFEAAFYQNTLRYDKQDTPIERAIACLCGLLQGNRYLDNEHPRYNLTVEKEPK
jgi:hypothetical protein